MATMATLSHVCGECGQPLTEWSFQFSPKKRKQPLIRICNRATCEVAAGATMMRVDLRSMQRLHLPPES